MVVIVRPAGERGHQTMGEDVESFHSFDFAACRVGMRNWGCLRVLKEAGCYLGQADDHRNTPAHYAARSAAHDEERRKGCLRVTAEYFCANMAVDDLERLVRS